MTRLAPENRQRDIVDAALRAAAVHGYQNVTRDQIAEEAKCTPGLVSHYLGTMTSARRDIMRAAVRVGCLPVIAQGLAARDPHAAKASDEVKQKALAQLTVG